MKRQKTNLAELRRETEALGARVIKSLSRSRCYITDCREIMIATTDGIARIPIEQVKTFYREFGTAISETAEMLTELSLEDKNKLAREKRMSYGTLQIIIGELGGFKNESEDR